MPYTPTVGRVIATREIDFIHHSGKVELAIVSIGEPVQQKLMAPGAVHIEFKRHLSNVPLQWLGKTQCKH